MCCTSCNGDPCIGTNEKTGGPLCQSFGIDQDPFDQSSFSISAYPSNC